MRPIVLGLAACLLLLAACAETDARRPTATPGSMAAGGPDGEEWMQLFNGQDLEGWTPKLTGSALGEDARGTFRAEGGLLKVRYDAYDRFGGRFGHLFYQTPFSHYVVAVEYRFVGEQAPGGAGWAVRNSGVMVHSQAPETMGTEQDFPISLEAQLLGGAREGERPTANLCTPGTHVVMEGALVTQHCVTSRSATYRGEQWVRAEVIVLGDSLVTHVVEGDTVLHYTAPQVGGGNVEGFVPEAKADGQPLAEGYIALQSESHPVDFRKVELLNLRGCTDPAAANYKSYYVAAAPGACTY